MPQRLLRERNREETAVNVVNFRGKLPFIAVIACIVLLTASPVMADARTDYLINLLKTGGSYRVKVQAAQTLGKIRCREALPALIESLKDPDEPVVVASAAAIAEIGDPSALAAIEQARRTASSQPVKAQLAATARILQSLTPTEVAGDRVASLSERPQYLVKVDAMGNSSASVREDITDVMKRIVTESLQSRSGIVIQSDNLPPAQVRQKLNREKLKGFIISGSLIKLSMDQTFIVVNITLNVFSNPEYNLVMMPSGEIRVPAGMAVVTPEEKNGLEEKAIRRLVDNLLSKILEAAPDVL